MIDALATKPGSAIFIDGQRQPAPCLYCTNTTLRPGDVCSSCYTRLDLDGYELDNA